MLKWFSFNVSSLSGDYTVDFGITCNDLEQLWKADLFWLLWSIIIACKNHSLLKAQWSVKLILGHLNIDSIQDRFEALKFIIDCNIDIFLRWETKLDSFSTGQFLIKGFTVPYRPDRNSKDGLLLYIRYNIPSKILTHSSKFDIETNKEKVTFEWFL